MPLPATPLDAVLALPVNAVWHMDHQIVSTVTVIKIVTTDKTAVMTLMPLDAIVVS